jgi:hypothetical protein
LADLSPGGRELMLCWSDAAGRRPATTEVPSQGIDSLELMLAANKGEPARPLQVASRRDGPDDAGAQDSAGSATRWHTGL